MEKKNLGNVVEDVSFSEKSINHEAILKEGINYLVKDIKKGDKDAWKKATYAVKRLYKNNMDYGDTYMNVFYAAKKGEIL